MSSHPDEESNSLSTNISTISPFDISTDIATIDTIEQPSLKNRKYGRMFTFYYKDNNPVFAVGPDWPLFVCMFVVNVGFLFFFLRIIWNNSFLVIKAIAVLFSLAQLASYFFTATINPGLPRYETQLNAIAYQKVYNYRFCKECNFWIDLSEHWYHCQDCGICIEGYDHHCPWTTKCVGKGNIKLFYGFLGMTFGVLFYFVFAIVMMNIYVKHHPKNK